MVIGPLPVPRAALVTQKITGSWVNNPKVLLARLPLACQKPSSSRRVLRPPPGKSPIARPRRSTESHRQLPLLTYWLPRFGSQTRGGIGISPVRAFVPLVLKPRRTSHYHGSVIFLGVASQIGDFPRVLRIQPVIYREILIKTGEIPSTSS